MTSQTTQPKQNTEAINVQEAPSGDTKLQDQQSSRWGSLPKEPQKFTYTKAQLLNLFSFSELPEGFTIWNGITSQKCLEPVNKTNLFKFGRDAKINPDPVTPFGRGRRGRGRGIGIRGRGKVIPTTGGKHSPMSPSSETETKPTEEVLPIIKKLMEKNIDLESMWDYRDKDGTIHKGPFALKKVKEWVDASFHAPDLEIRLQGEKEFVKFKDVIAIAEKQELKKQESQKAKSPEKPKTEEEDIRPSVVQSVLNVIDSPRQNQPLRQAQPLTQQRPPQEKIMHPTPVEITQKQQIPQQNVFYGTSRPIVPQPIQQHPIGQPIGHPMQQPTYPNAWGKPLHIPQPQHKPSPNNIEQHLKQALHIGVQMMPPARPVPPKMLTEEELLREQGLLPRTDEVKPKQEPVKSGKPEEDEEGESEEEEKAPEKKKSKNAKKKAKRKAARAAKKKEREEKLQKQKEEEEEKRRKALEERERLRRQKEEERRKQEEILRHLKEESAPKPMKETLTHYLPPQIIKEAQPAPQPVKGWNIPANIPPPIVDLTKIQKEELARKEKKDKRDKAKREEELKKLRESQIAWPAAVPSVTFPSFEQIQNEQKAKAEVKQSKQQPKEPKTVKAQQQAPAKPKTVKAQPKKVITSVWGVGALTNITPVSFSEIQQEELQKSKKQKSKQQQQQSIPATGWPSISGAVSKPTTQPKPTTKEKKQKPKNEKPKEKKPQTPKEQPKKEEDEEDEFFWDYDETKEASRAFTSQAPKPKEQKPKEQPKKKKEKAKEKAKKKKENNSTYANILGTGPKKAPATLDSEQFPSLAQTMSAEIKSTSQPRNTEFGGIEPSDGFRDWYRKQMGILGKKPDLTLMNFLLSCSSNQEIQDYIDAYIGESPASKKFADEFIRLKSFETEEQKQTKKRRSRKK